MDCYLANDLVEAITKTVKLMRVRNARIARWFTLRRLLKLRNMKLQQARRTMRSLLNRLSLREIGRVYDCGAFNVSYQAVLIAVAIVRARGGSNFPGVSRLMNRYAIVQCYGQSPLKGSDFNTGIDEFAVEQSHLRMYYPTSSQTIAMCKTTESLLDSDIQRFEHGVLSPLLCK